jgi:hypothetical protein
MSRIQSKALNVRIAASLLVTLVAAACSDQPVAPSSTATPNAAVVINQMTQYPDSMSVDFTVDADGGWVLLGPHQIFFPANSICDPAVSTYGVTEWDKPCVALTKPIDIHAEIRNSLVGGLPAIDFKPSLRFVPTQDAAHWVYLYFYTDAVRGMTEEQAKATFKILWSPALGMPGIDESLVDPTLKTRFRPKLGYVYRRIEHFSGYQVGAGVEEQF